MTSENTPNCIYRGVVWHERLGEHAHSFSYPIAMVALDLTRTHPHRLGPFFGFERWGILSVRRRYYLHGDGRSFLEQLQPHISALDCSEEVDRIYLITTPRVCGYGFNPVSFYLLYSQDARFLGMILEVNNTFGERHLYCERATHGGTLPAMFRFEKRFYVSPFYPQEGRYEVILEQFDAELRLKVNLSDPAGKGFRSGIHGIREPLTASTVARASLSFAWTAATTMAKILFEAVRLRYLRRAKPYRKPIPTDSHTIRAETSAIHRLWLWVLARWEH